MASVSGYCIEKKGILRLWKSDAVPSFEMWLRELGEILHLEKVCDKAWGPVLRHLGFLREEGVE